ncbi:MAG: DUF4397 domain-containing protein [Burkholderiaceae bacterium]
MLRLAPSSQREVLVKGDELNNMAAGPEGGGLGRVDRPPARPREPAGACHAGPRDECRKIRPQAALFGACRASGYARARVHPRRQGPLHPRQQGETFTQHGLFTMGRSLGSGFTMRFNKRHLLGLLAALPLAWLAACGGGDNGNDATLRLVNASAGYASLDLYVAETKEISAVGFGTGSDYASVKSGDSVENVLTSAGSTTELLNQTRPLSSGKKYTILAYGWEGALKSVIFTDDESAADSGKTKVGIYNGAVGAGSVDIYLTGEDETLESSEPIHSAVAESTSGSSGYVSVTSGTYRLRVTAAGSTDDVRLDVSGVTLNSAEVLTLVTTPGSGGVLVNAIGVVQSGAVTSYLNTKARVRVVPAVAGSAQVSVTAGSTTLITAAQSPSIGLYKLVPAGATTLHTVVSGTTLADTPVTLAAGADMTVLVYGTSAATAAVNPIADDNRLPTTASRFKLRLIHAAPSKDTEQLSMLLNSSIVIDSLSAGQASPFSTQTTVTGALLEVSSPSAGPFYTRNDTDFTSGGVYTLFIFDYPSGTNGVLTNAR